VVVCKYSKHTLFTYLFFVYDLLVLLLSSLYCIYSSLFTSNGSKNSKINRQTDRQKETVSINKEQTNYITVYKIPKKCKIKIENRRDVI